MKIFRMPLPYGRNILITLLILLGLGGLGGGIAMFLDPSGQSMGLPSDLLRDVPVDNFILPGIILTSVMGVFPLAIAWGVYQQHSWARWASALQGVFLMLWIGFQILLWGAPAMIQIVYLVWGGVLLILSLTPAIRRSG